MTLDKSGQDISLNVRVGGPDSAASNEVLAMVYTIYGPGPALWLLIFGP